MPERTPDRDRPGRAAGGIPRAGGVDASIALLREGYVFGGRRRARLGVDTFRTRLLGRDAVVMSGAEAVRAFYAPDRMTRRGALPPTTLRLLQDVGSVQLLDGDEHRHRKAMFTSLLGEDGTARLVEEVVDRWRAAIPRWADAGEVVLLDASREVLTEAVCAWAGIPVDGSDRARRARELGAAVDEAGRFGPRMWLAQMRRTRSERWARGVVERHRGGEDLAPEGSPLATVAGHRDPEGEPLPVEVAAVELLNLLRPTVAISVFVVHAAVALHRHAGWHERLAADDADVEPFVQEVRRTAPFFPMVGGRVREPFDWRGERLDEGTWVLVDLYGTDHDPRLWDHPDQLRPERFRGWPGDPSTLVPQGGGDVAAGHRCPGELATIEVLKAAVRLLTREMTYRVPPQDLGVDLSRLPALPRSRVVIDRVRPRP